MKNDVITIDITDLTPEGFGVGRYEGKVIFVSDTAVGDRCEVLIMKELKNHSFARLLKIITASRDRIEPNCEVCKKCGGCSFRHVSYGAELELKRNLVAQSLSRIGGLDIDVDDTVSDSPERYRNKVQYPFAPEGSGIAFGYYAKRSHRIVSHTECALQDVIFTDIARFCAEAAEKMGISAYDEQKGKGVLRHAVMRKNRKGEILLCLVVGEDDKRLKALASAVAERYDSVIGVHININKRKDNVIFGDETYKLCGADVLTDTLCGRVFELSIRAFYQVNAIMAEKLYRRAGELIERKKDGNIILDLYCGAGTIGLCVAGENDKLCGVEIIDAAVENAKRNAVLNGRSEENTLFVCGDAAVGVEECNKRFGSPDTVIVDPPRKGLDASVIETVVKASPERVVYISCDPATLARDCKIFAEYGYVTDNATPFDLFPRTGHVETVVCLTRIGDAVLSARRQ